jgi:hypothetical protein
MKLPRWFVVCLLAASALSLAITACLWWFGAPQRTVQQIAVNLGDRRIDDANRLMTSTAKWTLESDEVLCLESSHAFPGCVRLSPAGWEWSLNNKQMRYKNRSFAELFSGAARFDTHDGFLEWEVKRGRITLVAAHPEQWHPFMQRYVREFLQMQ